MRTEPHILNPLDDSGWDDALRAQAGATFFHTAAWARVLREAYGFFPRYFVAREAGELAALVPVMEVDSALTGRRGVSLPFTDYCEPLGSDASALQETVQSVLRFGREQGWKHVEFRSGSRFPEKAMPSLSYYGHRLDLTPGPDRLFDRLKSEVRTAIRKAQQAGVRAEVSDSLDAVRLFCRLNELTRRRHGLPPQPFAFFQRVHEHVLSKKRGIVVTAFSGDRVIASSMFFHFAGRAVFKYGASDRRFQSLRGNNLVMWEAVRWYARSGGSELCLGKTEQANEGLRQYKLGWGAAEFPVDYFKHDLRRQEYVQDRDPIEGWYNPMFRLLPPGVSRLIGSVLYRHMG